MTVTLKTSSPTVAAPVVFYLQAQNADGTAIDPYKVDSVTVYFLERNFVNGNVRVYSQTINGYEQDVYYDNAVPVTVVGTDEYPAYLSTDPDAAFLVKLTEDDDGNAATGLFKFEWHPNLTREGDFFVCWRWTEFPAGETLSDYLMFGLDGDTTATTTLPTHQTAVGKYETLADRLLPEMFKSRITSNDVTANVLDRLNKAVAGGFTFLENIASQMLDMPDANAIPPAYLPYLANLFRLPLRSNDVALWRRQIKEAVPTFKMKGTRGGLAKALSAAGVTLNSVTQYWQATSKAVYAEGFLVDQDRVDAGNMDFILEKLAILPAVPPNSGVSVRKAGETTHTNLDPAYVVLSNDDGVTTMTWNGDLMGTPISLEAGDYVFVWYQFGTVANQDVEDYIRGLPLADTRDEVETTYPLKNWNVKLIDDADPMFGLVVPTRHPFELPVVFGQVRTEFAYSENAYHMEEYNGSIRPSERPCDIDKSFLDACSACASSKFSIDVEVEELSDHRLEEVEDIVRDNVPFHAVLHSINYTGSVTDVFVPPMEEIECLLTGEFEDAVLLTNNDFNRAWEDSTDVGEITRGEAASMATVATDTGTGANLRVTLFSPGYSFQSFGISDTDNVLELLSGPHAGTYSVENYRNGYLDIVLPVTHNMTWPVDTAALTYRLSNNLYSQADASVYQDDRFVFRDTDADLYAQPIQIYSDPSPWRLNVLSGVYAGTYYINKVLPDNSVEILDWPGTATATDQEWELRMGNNSLVTTGTKGLVSVQRRGRVESDLVQTDYHVKPGDYLLYDGTEYLITGFGEAVGPVDTCYISGFVGSDVVGAAEVVFRRRRVDNGIGTLGLSGMVLVTGTDYESSLGIIDGDNPPGVKLEEDKSKDCFLVLIGSTYYTISRWDGTDIYLDGPVLAWGIDATTTSVSFSIIQFSKTTPIVVQNGEVLPFVDRRGVETIVLTTETVSLTATAMATMLNAPGGTNDVVRFGEDISVDIEY